MVNDFDGDSRWTFGDLGNAALHFDDDNVLVLRLIGRPGIRLGFEDARLIDELTER
jgi:hypothetical protein